MALTASSADSREMMERRNSTASGNGEAPRESNSARRRSSEIRGCCQNWIAPAVARDTQVCVYDRAGLGWSDQATGAQDGLAVATDLHTLLDRAHVAGPYVLVGHSTGGVYMRVFAARFPEQVGGMVLLDSQPNDAFARLPNYPGFYTVFRPATGLMPSLARVGVMRLFYPLQARALESLGDKPLAVVTAGSEAQDGWLPLQDEMAALSTRSVHHVLPDATHTSLIEDERDSAVSSQAIQWRDPR